MIRNFSAATGPQDTNPALTAVAVPECQLRLTRVLRSALMATAFSPLMLATAAQAQDGAAQPPETVAPDGHEEANAIIVTADPAGLLKLQRTDSVLGVTRPLVETPRSISIVSDTTMDRYSIEDVDDFVTTSPGTFGGSFFGVPGAVSIRGSISDTYFRGFKRVQNDGMFPAPIGASSRIELIRGPAPAIYGASRIGGLLNFYPRTAEKGQALSGEVSYTTGSYDKNKYTAELQVPFYLGGRYAGLSLYGELEDSGHFIRGRKPNHKLVQTSFTHDLSDSLSIELGGMYLRSKGYYQTLGWNRVTQDLIDNGTYITGRDTDMTDLDGNGRLTPDEVDAAVGSFFGTSNIRQFIEFFFGPPGPNTAFDLDEGVGTTKLDRRTAFLDPDSEIQRAKTITAYVDLVKEFDDSKLKLQGFYDRLDGKVYVSSGFAAQHEASTLELRASYQLETEFSDDVKAEFYATASHRIYDSILHTNFLSGYLVVDRRDLSRGATGSDIFDSPFSIEPGGNGIGWDSIFDSRWTDTGGALVVDLKFWDKLSVIANGRYDYYRARSINTGNTVFNPALKDVLLRAKQGDFSYSISGNFDTGFGIIPYITYAEGSAVETNGVGGISPEVIAAGNILGASDLLEAGVKFSLLRDTLVGSLAYYEQHRTRQDPFGNISGEKGEGVEFEMRYLINDHLTLTGAATVQDFTIAPPGACGSGNGEFVVVPPSRFGISGEDGYGGIFAALNASCLPELQNGYRRNTIPKEVYSAYLTYTSPETEYGTFGGTLGGTYISKTGGKIRDAIVIPGYFSARAAVFAEYKSFNITATIENLFDKEYFTPLQGVYEEVGIIPEAGRTFRVTGTFKF
ncbi:TonB-dependent receptor [Novosphingobium endophyticum]|uniref:TonB-dependent receptor n=1 Tax=Novosphingobium endophyticum TaxID=1955250 RepID=A0A916X5Z9_9SPHN|nr:TonB-dependent receptor plug domain-containing protein [Novosphingobium endophyticum]GGC12286.1 TonB-dependent receptor [Novosphingobium endophyticum]